MSRHAPGVAALLAAGLQVSPAQTFVVDVANGPGTSFTSLPTAAASVPDGAVLLVRPGAYAGFSIAQKGLVVLAEPGVDITGAIAVANTAPQQTFVLRGVAWSVPPQWAACVQLDACAGTVVLEDLAVAAWPFNNFVEPLSIDAVSCAQLVVRECTLSGYTHFDGVTAAIERSTLTGTSGFGFVWPTSTTYGLVARDSDVQIVGSSVRGGDGFGSGPIASLAASEGILIVLNTSLRLVESTVTGGTDGAGQRYAIAGLNSSARIDTASTLQGGLQPWGITAQLLPMPWLRADGAPLGGTLQASVTTAVGDLVILAVGLRGAPATVPGFEDAFWLDPAVHVFHAIGVQQPFAPVAGAVAVPNAPGLVGLSLVWHGACFGPSTGRQNTNPGFTLVR